MATNYKITRHSKYEVSITDTKNHTKDYILPGMPGIIEKIIIDPNSFEHGFKTLPESVRDFIDLSATFSTTDLYIYSETPVHIKMTRSDAPGDYSTIHTSLFQYKNPDVKLKFSIANGTLDYDPLAETFTSNDASKDQSIFYVNIEEL